MTVSLLAILRSRCMRLCASAVVGLGALLVAAAMASSQDRAKPTTLSSADPATTQPSNRDGRGEPRPRPGGTQDRPDRDGERGGTGDGPGRGPPRGWSEPTAEEWEQALAFLRQNSPHRLKIYERFEQEWRQQQDPNTTQPAQLPRSLRGARARFAARVQLLKMLEERDPALFEVAIDQFRLEDQIIGHLQSAREARAADNEAAAEEAFARALEAVRSYAAGSLKERESRIERMRQDLSREEQRLEQDRTNFDTLVERLLERFQRSLPGAGEGPRDGGREGSGEGDRNGQRQEQNEPARGDGGASG